MDIQDQNLGTRLDSHKLIAIKWPEVDKQKASVSQNVEFSPNYQLSETDSKQKSKEEVDALISNAFDFLSDALSISGLQSIEVVKMDVNEVASFVVDDDGAPHLKLAFEWYDGVSDHVFTLLSGKRKTDQNVKVTTLENGEETMEFKVAAGAAIAYVIQSIGHEMYHARQAFQDIDFFSQTLNENIVADVSRQMSKEEGDVWDRRAKRIYKDSLGERGANGFAIRFLKEFKKSILAKEDIDRSVTEKLFLCGVDKLISERVLDIKKKFCKLT